MKPNNFALAIGATLLGILLLCVTGLIIAGREPDAVLYLGAAVIIPTVTGLFGIKATTELRRDVDSVKSAVGTVKALTNGNTSRLLDIIQENGGDVADLRRQLREAQGETS